MKTFLSGEKVEGRGNGACELRAQLLRAAASRVGPLALRLREVPLFSGGAHIILGGSVKYTTLANLHIVFVLSVMNRIG